MRLNGHPSRVFGESDLPGMLGCLDSLHFLEFLLEDGIHVEDDPHSDHKQHGYCHIVP